MVCTWQKLKLQPVRSRKASEDRGGRDGDIPERVPINAAPEAVARVLSKTHLELDRTRCVLSVFDLQGFRPRAFQAAVHFAARKQENDNFCEVPAAGHNH